MAERRARGTGSVRHHAPSGLWRATLPKRLDPSERPNYFPTHEQATAWLDAEVARIDDAAARAAAEPSGEMTVYEYMIRWLDVISTSEDWSPRTLKGKLVHIMYLSALHHRPMESIRRLDLQPIVSELQADPPDPVWHAPKGEFRRRQRLTPKSVHSAVSTWRRAFLDALDDGIITINPTVKLALPPKRLKRAESWTPSETRLLVPTLVGHPHEAMYALIFGSGLRIGEARGLAWTDVDWDRSRAWIWQQADGAAILQRVKGRVGRWVILPLPVVAALRRQQARQTWAAVYVSEHQPGMRVSRETVAKHLRALARAAGVRELPPHAGRHAVGNVLGSGGIPLPTISDRLGHKNRITTADWYMESDTESEARATELLETLFSGTADPNNREAAER